MPKFDPLLWVVQVAGLLTHLKLLLSKIWIVWDHATGRDLGFIKSQECDWSNVHFWLCYWILLEPQRVLRTTTFCHLVNTLIFVSFSYLASFFAAPLSFFWWSKHSIGKMSDSQVFQIDSIFNPTPRRSNIYVKEGGFYHGLRASPIFSY